MRVEIINKNHCIIYSASTDVVIRTPEGRERKTVRFARLLQSYTSIICGVDKAGRIWLDRRAWDYSSTTGRHRNAFLGEDINETRKKITNGTYRLCDMH